MSNTHDKFALKCKIAIYIWSSRIFRWEVSKDLKVKRSHYGGTRPAFVPCHLSAAGMKCSEAMVLDGHDPLSCTYREVRTRASGPT